MKRPVSFFLAFLITAIALAAAPKPTPDLKGKGDANRQNQSASSGALALSAHGWSYVKGEWVHPEGFKYVGGKIVRTTAPKGKTPPKPPGKLALDNAQKLTANIDSKTEAEKKLEARQRNRAPSYAPRTGSRL
jgi:hypothetical protein